MKATASIKTIAASKAEVEMVQQRLRNGLNPPEGYTLDFSKDPPVRKIAPDELKEIQKELKAEHDAAQKIEDEDEEAGMMADFLAIESIAQATRPTGQSANTPPANTST